MSAPGTDERLHRDALMALLSPVLPDLYDVDSVPGASGPEGSTNPGTLPADYTTLSIERDLVLIDRTCGIASRSAWEVTLESVSSRYVDNVRNAQFKIATTFEGALLTVDGHESVRVQFAGAKSAHLDKDTKRWVARWSGSYVL